MRRIAIPLSVALMLGLLAAPGRAATVVTGPITEDTTWTSEGSPYVLVGEVVVTNYAHLTIEPGVRVEAQTNAALLVGSDGAREEVGGLVAEGTEDEPIVFTSQTGERDWAGISLLSDPYPYPTMFEDRFRYVEISNAATSLYVNQASVTAADHIVMDDNGIALWLDNPKGDLELTDSVLTNNNMAVTGRVRDIATVTRNDFWNNRVNIVPEPQDPFSCFQGGAWEIHENDILRGPMNEDYWTRDVYTPEGSASSDYTISATDNWWGSSDESRLDGRFNPQFRCCPERPRAEIVWRPVSTAPNTEWEPPGDVPDPDPDSMGIADPVGWTRVDAPPDRTCLERDTVGRMKATFLQALGDHDGVVFKIARLTASGCRTWSVRHDSFRPGCRRFFEPEEPREDVFVFRFPRTLTQGRYVFRSAYLWGEGRKESAMPGLNVSRVTLIQQH